MAAEKSLAEDLSEQLNSLQEKHQILERELEERTQSLERVSVQVASFTDSQRPENAQ